MKERLQKIIARAGVASRRKSEEFIKDGRVSVDGKIVTEMGLKVDPRRQVIKCDGKVISQEEEKIYILLNKPKGYVTTLHDPQGRPIVTSLLKGIDARVFPVGRLDFDTEGALLLTNDGELAQRIIHPKFEVNKTYVVTVAGRPASQQIALLESGVIIENKKTSPAKVKVLKGTKHTTIIKVIIHEGRKRQVRKMFSAIGHKVLELKRVAYGGLKLGGLPTGKYRVLKKTELARIFS